ncbi:DUF5666 domain-containing protein [Gandjariella thermophila]|nr:DUF5666 domain-containing protein [Gandjariella thermophila]
MTDNPGDTREFSTADEARPTSRRRRLFIALTAGVSGAVLGGVVVAGLLTGGFATAASDPGQAPAAPSAAAKAHNGKAAKAREALRKDKRVQGVLAAVGNGTITVTADGTGQAVSVPTGDATRVRGLGKDKRSVSDLKPGDRVLVLIGDDGKAALIADVHGHVAGAVTAINGDQATIERADGLTQQVDLSKVANKPKVGDIVAVTGQPAAGGGTLTAEKLVELPKA